MASATADNGARAKHEGALPSQTIAELLDAGFVSGGSSDNVNPASLDLSLSDEIYEVEGIFQPKPNETIRELLSLVKNKAYSLDEPLKRGKMYVARLNETCSLPQSVYGYCNPKSTTGRNDVHVRVLADRVPRYDAITPSGFKGELWLAINPRSFPVKLGEGATLSQVRFFTRDTRFDETELEIAHEKYKLLFNPTGRAYSYNELKIRDNDGSLILTSGLDGDVVGYECTGTDEVLDFNKIRHYKHEPFFTPLRMDGDVLHLKSGHFYILSTNEALRVPPELACEMAPTDERNGEFRSHYAGFFDPGWGWGEDGEGVGRPATLEVRPFEDLIVRSGQPVAKVRFERMTEAPEVSYDAKKGSNYTGQWAAALSKQFKPAS